MEKEMVLNVNRNFTIAKIIFGGRTILMTTEKDAIMYLERVGYVKEFYNRWVNEKDGNIAELEVCYTYNFIEKG